MTLLLGFAAVNTGNNLLYLVVSALLGFMAISGVVGKANIDGLQLGVETSDEVYAGRPTVVALTLENRKRWLPSFLLEVALGEEASVVPLVEGRGRRRIGLTCAFAHHGPQSLRPVTVRSVFPINFFVRSRTRVPNRQVLVFPTPLACAESGGGEGRHVAAGEQRLRRGSEGEVSRIAEYSGSEPMKLIHWKLSARQEALKVKELSDATREPVVLHLEELPGRTVAERLGCAAYLVNRLSRQGRPVGLRLPGRSLAPAVGRGHRLKLLAELALYDSD